MSRPSLPIWLAHAFRWQRGPVPWGAVGRGALGAAPMLVAVLIGDVPVAVPAALGAMFAGVNDRPGSRRSALTRIGFPALGGALGLAAGHVAQVSALPTASAVLGLALVGLIAGCISAVGPVASATGTQLLITAALGWGIATSLAGWAQLLAFLSGAAWLLGLRVAVPARTQGGGPYLLDGEREAVAAAYEAVAVLLEAEGPSERLRRRVALSAALDRAQDALAGPRLRRGVLGAAERRLHAQLGAVHPLAEAATALTWEGERLPARVARGPRRLAEAVRSGGPCGPLPAPGRATAAQRAFDDALLGAAQTFGSPAADAPAPVARRWARSARGAIGPAGREYGLRVALATAASTAAAQALHPAHWYWLPATAAFLVKPDLGPLVSRTLNRVLGTVVGAGAFGLLAPALPGTLWPVAVVAATGALIPLSLRHFALQTGVITVLVLTLVGLDGQAGLVGSRIVDTLLACALVLLVGHVPIPGHHGGGVAARRLRAERAAGEYLRHVLAGGAADPAARGRLRRAAYRELAVARASVELAAAELPSHARPAVAAAPVLRALERLVDTATAAAVELDHGDGELSARHRRELERLLRGLPPTG